MKKKNIIMDTLDILIIIESAKAVFTTMIMNVFKLIAIII